MDFEVGGDGPQKLIFANGEIRIGDDEKLHRFVGGLPGNISLFGVVLNSPGGNFVEGVRLATTVRTSQIKTGVPSDGVCASACFLIFAAGTEKIVFERARVGVHSASYLGMDNMSAQAATTLMARKAAELGVPPAIIGKMVTTPSSDMAWLTEEDLQAMGVSTRQANPVAYQPGSALIPGSNPSSAPVVAPTPAYVPPPNLPGNTQQTSAADTPAFNPSPAFTQGRADRSVYEAWFNAQTDELKQGAAWWAENRSQAVRNHLTCATQGFTPMFSQGCAQAQSLLSPADRRRTTEPDYRSGWNSL